MIRDAIESDLKSILGIYNYAILHTTAVYTYDEETLDERIKWFEVKKENNFPIIVFEIEGIVAGFATYGSFRAWPAYQYTIEHSIYVDSTYRNKGIATQLLKALIRRAKDEGYKTMVAGIDASNKGSMKLHEKLGFKHTGTLTQVGFKFDQWLDLAFYQLEL